MKRLLTAACLFAIAATAAAQTYPSQAIRLVVPYTPAGATDVLARLVADKVSANTGWPIIIDNKAGAGSGGRLCRNAACGTCVSWEPRASDPSA